MANYNDKAKFGFVGIGSQQFLLLSGAVQRFAHIQTNC